MRTFCLCLPFVVEKVLIIIIKVAVIHGALVQEFFVVCEYQVFFLLFLFPTLEEFAYSRQVFRPTKISR